MGYGGFVGVINVAVFLTCEVTCFFSFVSAQELELEDTQSRLQQDLRHRMETEGWHAKCITWQFHSHTLAVVNFL